MDNVLEQPEREKLEAHLAQCSSCKNEFEIEALTRKLVRSRCHKKQAPGHVVQQISLRLQDNSGLESVSWWRKQTLDLRFHLQYKVNKRGSEHVSWWRRWASSRFAKPAVAFAIAFLAVLLIVNNKTPINGPRLIEASTLPANDVIRQSLTNYISVVNGEIKPQVESDRPDFVENFFVGKTEFPVVVPTMSGCTLLGGVLNEFDGKALAHVVYNHKSEIIYVYETCWETVLSGTPLRISQDVQDELKRTRWFATSTPDGRSVVMWTNGKTLCSAVSRLDVPTLMACLSAAQ